jgi:hypothetical protein
MRKNFSDPANAPLCEVQMWVNAMFQRNLSFIPGALNLMG